jgi:charged multivesicular body protein 6
MEYSLVEQQVVMGLKAGNAVLEEIHKEMSIENVEKLMQDTADAIAYQNEISELLGGKLTDEDEQELLDELDEIAQEETTSKVPASVLRKESSKVELSKVTSKKSSKTASEVEEDCSPERELVPA